MNDKPIWDNETTLIVDKYKKRDTAYSDEGRVFLPGFFAYRSVAHLVRIQERHRETLCLLCAHGFHPLTDIHILDMGCGNGNMLRSFLEWGARPENVVGIELLPWRVQRARYLNPNLDVNCASATDLSWPDNSFDLVCQHTVFTSILDQAMRQQVATEMNRVLRPGGAVLWYDFFDTKPGNSDTHGVKVDDIQRLFPTFEMYLRRLTLSTKIANRLPESLLPVLYPLLSTAPNLRTH